MFVPPSQFINNLGAPHIESFDYMLREGLADCVANMRSVQFELPNKDRIKISVSSFHIDAPTVPRTLIGVRNRNVYPSECRQRGASYKGMAHVRINWSVNGQPMPSIDKEMGEIPVMLKSSACNLHGLSPKELVERGEHETEWGGTFILKGHEKLIRMLLMTRKNYPIALKRGVWKDRGQNFSDIGITMRTVMSDQTSTNNVLHFLSNGRAKLMFSHRKMLSFVPPLLVLKAMVNCTDEYVYQRLIAGYEDDQYYLRCVQEMQREVHEEGIHTHQECKDYLGEIFRSRFTEVPSWASTDEVTDFMLQRCFFIHLDSFEDKFNILVLMVQKLFQAAQGKCKVSQR